MANSGFVKLRRGIVDHLRSGRISSSEFMVYVLVILEADYHTGTWFGSGQKLAVLYDIPARTCRDVLEKLHRKGYIRRFMKAGKHGNYPVLVNKFECRDGAGNEVYLNAIKSNDWRNPIFESAATVPGECHDGATVQEVRTKNKEKTPRKKQRGPHTSEQVRQIEAKQKRLEMEDEVRRELYVGAGPRISDVMPDLASKIRELAKAKAL